VQESFHGSTPVKSISIVIPAYNEQHRLPSTLETVSSYLRAHSWEFCEIVVVNDGSTDATAQVAHEIDSGGCLRVLDNPGNRGKGYSVRHGMLEAKGEWILYTDADLSAPIEEIEKLFTAVLTNQAAGAIGSRALNRALVGVHQPLFREYAGRLFNVVMRAITGLQFRDTQCGFKLYHSEAARQIFSMQQLDGFGFDVEDLFIAKRLGYRILEVPVRWNDVAGTKVGMGSGLNAFLDLIRVRWFHFRGHYNH
jgi:glycosyltransferase involved in cell wall biosynthesis